MAKRKTPRRTPCADPFDGAVHRDPSKALVIARIAELVSSGAAIWTRLANGGVELRLFTGEVLKLGANGITRL
jgi:hypothetical protein